MAEPDEPVMQGLDAGEMVGDVLARSAHKTFVWIRRHSNLVQILLLVTVVSFFGWRIYVWRRTRSLEQASDQLLAAVEAERGTVGEQPPIVQPEQIDTRPQFNSDQERLKRAEELYRKALAGKPTASTTILARLGLAGVLYELGRLDEALAEYQKVHSSPLAAQDVDVRSRSAEGIGLCLEGKGDREGASRAFRELENSDLPEFSRLGLYHQARMAWAKGDREQAKAILAKLREKHKKDQSSAVEQERTFVERAAEELELAIDPSEAKSRLKLAQVGFGSNQDSLEQLERLRQLLEQLQKGQAPSDTPVPGGSAVPSTRATGSSHPVPAPVSSG